MNNKGFTLAELIVVLVILAILAAILVPSMISWIDEANRKSIITEARSAYVATQTVASQIYGEKGFERNQVITYKSIDPANAEFFEKIKTVGGFGGEIVYVTLVDGQVTELVYAGHDSHYGDYKLERTKFGQWEFIDTIPEPQEADVHR